MEHWNEIGRSREAAAQSSEGGGSGTRKECVDRRKMEKEVRCWSLEGKGEIRVSRLVHLVSGDH